MNILKRLQAQINPFDNGATFKNPQPSRPQVPIGILQRVAARPPMSRDNQITNSLVARGMLNPRLAELYHQGRRPMAEDDALVQGPQGLHPINADIRNFQMQPQGLPEDAGLVNGPQGYGPMNSDIANFRNPMMQPNMLPQYEDAYTPDLALNQTYTQGNPQPTRLGYRVQDARYRR